ncbi:HEXXH motif-containing putative peptide modification protein [Luedemannella flava]
MALLLIHEQQHMTLGAVYDLVPLCVTNGEARHDAPWRLDPRPVPALLQGTFAHLGVTDFWRVTGTRPASTGPTPTSSSRTGASSPRAPPVRCWAPAS